MLQGEKVNLRAIEPSDSTLIYLWENDIENWKFTNTDAPLSMFEIYQLIEEQRAVRESGQVRLIIQDKETNTAVGAIDIYNIDFKNGFGTVGILIAEEQYRRKGFAADSLNLLAQYAKEHLQLHHLTCGIQSSNLPSQSLFEKCNYLKIGTRTNWFLVDGKREDEYIYQLML